MNINATYINIYNVCKRELWLHANEIRFEHTSDIVYDGKLIHEDSYPLRSAKYEEVEIDGIKVDYYDTRNKVIHEIKKSNKVELAHEWQLKYYMYVFEQHGVTDVKGILEYPTLRKTQPVVLSDVDRDRIKEMLTNIRNIIESEECPPLQKKGICRNCSYYEFCFTKEIDE
jgi:CRISPR-associated exonuclease Cas4